MFSVRIIFCAILRFLVWFLSRPVWENTSDRSWQDTRCLSAAICVIQCNGLIFLNGNYFFRHLEQTMRVVIAGKSMRTAASQSQHPLYTAANFELRRCVEDWARGFITKYEILRFKHCPLASAPGPAELDLY